MATRNTERIRYRYGICLNDNCEKCKSKEVQEIPARKDFVCQNPECGKPLRECPPPKKRDNKKLIGIIAGLAALIAVVFLIFFRGGSPKVEALTLDKTNVSFLSGQSERLNVSVEPKDATYELVWQSSSEDVVKVLDGVLTAKNVGKSTVRVYVKDNEEISASCECTVLEEDVDMETMDIQEEPFLLRPGGHQQLTVKVTPENQNETISWTSSDESIATVTHKGKVEAIRVGEVRIIARSSRTGIADTAAVIVEGVAEAQNNASEATQAAAPSTAQPTASQPKATKPTTAQPKATKPAATQPTAAHTSKPAAPRAASGSKDLGYATFKGTWPNDVNGRMIFKSSHVIDSRDPKSRVAEAGDYVIGEWSEGHLVQGIWYGSDNVVKGSIIIGK